MLTLKNDSFKEISFFHYKTTTVSTAQDWAETIEFSIIKFKSQLRFWIDSDISEIIKQKISFCNCKLLKLA